MKLPYVAATLIVGAQPEPHLPLALESIASAVDFCVVDYNGVQEDNYRALQESRLYREGRLQIGESQWQNFAQARNHTLAMLPPQTEWFMRLDADEVHFPEQLQILTRQLLPALSPRVGMLDCYSQAFAFSWDYLLPLVRRHDFLIRYHPGMRWERGIHEQLSGRQGIRVAAPYLFHHYATLNAPQVLIKKHQNYDRLTAAEPSLPPNPFHADTAAAWLGYYLPQILKYRSGLFPELPRHWAHNPKLQPPYMDFYKERLERLLAGKTPPPQRGQLRRILFRLPALLLQLRSWAAIRAALSLVPLLRRELAS